MLRYAPNTKKSIESIVSMADMQFIEELIASKPYTISSNTLSILLEAHQSLRNAVIKELPLELALTQILNVEKK